MPPVYRHVTNLRVPFEFVDLGLLALLSDYKIGAPQPARHGTATPAPKLQQAGVVGLYATIEEMSRECVVRRTGWKRPSRIMGQAWRPLDVKSE